MKTVSLVLDMLVPQERIEKTIVTIRGQRVMIDADLARLYGVTTKVLNQSVKRNLGRFPSDFMFQLRAEEAAALRSQFVTSKGRGGRQYRPYVFTEQGVAMLSSVLRSERARASDGYGASLRNRRAPSRDRRVEPRGKEAYFQ